MKKTMLLATLSLCSMAHAYEAKITKGQMNASLDNLLNKARQDTGVNFNAENIQLVEERNLATSKYKFYVQTNQLIPVRGTAIRIWTDLKTDELILAEMHLDEKAKIDEQSLAAKFKSARFNQLNLKSSQLTKAISQMATAEVIKHDTDNKVLGIKFNDQWVNGDLVRQVEVRGRRGVHHISISLFKNKVIKKNYIEFPQSETFHTVKANVFPIYEEVEGTGEKLDYEVRDLKFISSEIADGGENPLGGLAGTKYPEGRYHPILAETEVGRSYNIWSEATLRRQVEDMVSKLPRKANNLSNGMLLQGKYATINLHPAIKDEFKGVNFPLKAGPNHQLGWKNVNGAWEAQPVSGLLGRPIKSQEDLLNNIPQRLPDHNPTTYINAGFDEIQVYYGVTVLMDALNEMGFTDKELSSKPFHAFLYDPDIGMRDNAYYTDNTINFTTYNPGTPNLARDNPTIWHELGHGVMDRLMGAHLGFADAPGGYGGLSEGMADFIAKLVVEHQTEGASFPGKNDFRIENSTGFYLTNEFHDEGEAYGGAMNDMLAHVVSEDGRDGLFAFTDLTLEAMRLTRNHPSLSAAGWFEHMLYADELGSEQRSAGQFKNIITEALSARNFSFDRSFQAAKMTVVFNNIELTSSSSASRELPLTPCDASGTIKYDLKVSLTEGTSKFIKFPATVKVEYKKGALQGAIKWGGEATNPETYQVKSASELLTLPISASMKCDTVNQPDGSCKDYAYLQVYNQGSSKPVAKKRFYLKIKNNDSCKR